MKKKHLREQLRDAKSMFERLEKHNVGLQKQYNLLQADFYNAQQEIKRLKTERTEP